MVINHLLNGMILEVVLRKLARKKNNVFLLFPTNHDLEQKNKNWMEVPNFLIFSHQQPGER